MSACQTIKAAREVMDGRLTMLLRSRASIVVIRVMIPEI